VFLAGPFLPGRARSGGHTLDLLSNIGSALRAKVR
jgi:hypothetical protein